MNGSSILDLKAFGQGRVAEKLIGDHVPAYARQWQVIDDAHAQKMLSGILAFELQSISLQCRLMLNQHRFEAFSTMQAMYTKGSDDKQALG